VLREVLLSALLLKKIKIEHSLCLQAVVYTTKLRLSACGLMVAKISFTLLLCVCVHVLWTLHAPTLAYLGSLL